MHRRFYTIFILPHAHARFRKLHLSRNFILTTCCLVGLGLLGGAVTPHLIFKVQAQSEVLADLQAENRQLRAEKERFETSIEAIGHKVEAIESRASKLARAVGLDKLPSGRPASGGALTYYPDGDTPIFDGELEALGSRLRTLDASFQTLDQAWAERGRLLAHTPSLMPVAGFFSDGFGWRVDPFTGQRAFHEGVDIVAPAGAMVRAPAEGVVTRAARVNGYGRTVDLSHGYGYGTRFGHLSQILVRPGARVHRGDVIGRVGSSGRSTGPHLHYEVFREGRHVNPRQFLGERGF